ncbi:MAG: hypothetical protein KDB61_05055, partial [Planctomycetes bacterium]|nr:hypothetical protein [Planctomycetota bacterium]
AQPDLRLSEEDRAKLLAFAQRHMGSKLQALFDAEDILQDALLSAYQAPAGYERATGETGGGVVTWLHTIVLHRIWNLSRAMRTRVRPRRDTGLPPSLVQFQNEGLDEHHHGRIHPDPIRSLMAPELQAQTLKAIGELDGERRLTLVLRGLLGSSWPTITFLTGKQRESARKFHQRCTQSLRERFLP